MTLKSYTYMTEHSKTHTHAHTHKVKRTAAQSNTNTPFVTVVIRCWRMYTFILIPESHLIQCSTCGFNTILIMLGAAPDHIERFKMVYCHKHNNYNGNESQAPSTVQYKNKSIKETQVRVLRPK